MSKLFHYLIIVSLVLLAIKPLLRFDFSKQMLSTTQYTTTNSKCSGNSPTTSFCQTSVCYTLANEERLESLYLYIFAGLLYFIYVQLNSISPYSRLFKPPILSY
ncbi:hypothetical protein [Legionella cardiaca]|uniref:Transmembrane protein n=1 Tax=Legionella cardiaca TaxID=1071983 RepID=A0ABY8ASZ9_9GAMM|nr:hypothetical protein [Legionella cardiaca]WED43633.1 hypothetical protein PXX05_02330 [Legionella cardiaca]